MLEQSISEINDSERSRALDKRLNRPVFPRVLKGLVP